MQERIETVADESDLEEVYNTERHLLYVACTVPPSTGGCVAQRVHVRASRRARSRRLLLSRANSRHRSGSLPPYCMPAALAFAHLARSALRRFSPQCRHKVRSGAGLDFPHLGHMPRAIRSAVMRS